MLATLVNVMLGWPFIIFITAASIICTVLLRGIQFRRFFAAWRATVTPSESASITTQDLSPLQAFVSTLNTNLGNGSVAGMAVAVACAGPGAAFWVVVFGILLMAVRFAEVYLSSWYGAHTPHTKGVGGPMLYLEQVPFIGKALAYLFALFCLLFGLVSGNMMQANSIGVSLNTTWNVPPAMVAIILVSFVLYVLMGGAQRIIKVSDAIVPIKVGIFTFASVLLLLYHITAIPAALKLIFISAFNPKSIAGGALAVTLQQALRTGAIQAVLSTESGLGTAAVFFGFTGSKDALNNSYMGMISTFVSTLVCFVIGLGIVVSGVWDSGLSSTALTIASFSTVFGKLAGWIVTFLSASFGAGLIVAYAYVSRTAWLFLTGNRFKLLFMILYCLSALVGSVVSIQPVWDLVLLVNGGMVITNLIGVLYLLPRLDLKETY